MLETRGVAKLARYNFKGRQLWNFDNFVIQTYYNTTGKIIVNQEIQEEAIVPSCNVM